jgi:hypothetical protein
MANHFYELLLAREELQRRSTLKLTSPDIVEVMRAGTTKAVAQSRELMAEADRILKEDRRMWNCLGTGEP